MRIILDRTPEALKITEGCAYDIYTPNVASVTITITNNHKQPQSVNSEPI